MSSIPGAFFTDDSDDEPYNDGLPGGLSPTASDLIETDPDDGDFAPESDIAFTDGDSDDEDLDMADEDEAEDVADDGSPEPRGTLSIGIDRATRSILLVDSNGNSRPLTEADLAGSALTFAQLQAMLLSRLGLASGGGRRRRAEANDEDEDEEDEEEDSDEDEHPYWGAPRKKTKQWYELPTEPNETGVRLERGGEFGPPPKSYIAKERKFTDYSPSFPSVLRERELNILRSPKSQLGHLAIPNTPGVEVAQHQSKVYSGQYSADGNFFYSASQAMRVYIYDTRNAPRTGNKSVLDAPIPRSNSMYGTSWQHRTSMKTIKVVKANRALCQWTITDATLSADNQFLCYSSITPYLHLVKTGEETGAWESGDDDQTVLDITNGRGSMSRFGVWSVRFSNDAKELVAGANDGQMFVYDLETQRTILRVDAHSDDVNAVAFADSSSSNLLLSGSDDSFIKVWDRRSLSGQRASGTLVGHTEGITFVEPKGDGRYCLSNGKDQGMKLWDLRMMVTNEEFDQKRLNRLDFGIPGWDYRQSYYSKPRYKEHPHDVSVMTYRGHAVLRTLIRCHFSPASTTDQRYVYSGSSDGKIHIWSLDGLVMQTLDRRYTHPLLNRNTGDYNDPSSSILRSSSAPGARGWGRTVRDVAWHPYRPEIMSTSWGEDGESGSIALHEWSEKGWERRAEGALGAV
ncbi:WD40-repeat-containing domain protein [Leucosporidium creatinivorum]|uniref:WD40-repeat-containing domain protein n=1 Tax=Leucosporidium creatinivorum TaxID=106004 RepID=A0A1Y2D268_9BASI|nr:WD40-repeat-containing domain protein [Leucosporidium creatinivorum]